MKGDMSITSYAPPPAHAVLKGVLEDIDVFQTQAINLAFLVLPVEQKTVFQGNRVQIPSLCWKTVCCDLQTGEFINPFTTHPRRRVADLLAQPRGIFMEWASNSLAVNLLPLTLAKPDWLRVAEKRLHRCQPHPDKARIPQDDNWCDFTASQAVIDRVRAAAGRV